MPSTQAVDRSPWAVAVAKRYRRRERPLSALVVVLAVAGFLATFVATLLVPTVVVGALPIVVVRAPTVEARETVRIRTDKDTESAAEPLGGLSPPILLSQ